MTFDELFGEQLEPQARECGRGIGSHIPLGEVATLSLAISLKRIADCLDDQFTHSAAEPYNLHDIIQKLGAYN